MPGRHSFGGKKYTGFDRRELNMVFQFDHTSLTDGSYGKWTDQRTYLPDLKWVFDRWQNGLRGQAWNCLFWGNHDQPRAVSKFGCPLPEFRELSAKMLCACLYLMQGTPYIYQGEELGMTNAGFFDLDQYRDIESINAYHALVDSGALSKRMMLEYLGCTSRDNARTPMQWDDGAGAGFTSGNPWITMGPNWRAVNAKRERNDPKSVFHFYQKVLRLRRDNRLIQDGSFTLLWLDHERIFAYRRDLDNTVLYVLCNFSEEQLELPVRDMIPRGQLVLTNYDSQPQSFIQLRPFEVLAIQTSAD